MLIYAVLFISAGVLAYLLAFPLRSFAVSFGIVDLPDRRKIHQVPIPLLGGVAIFIAFSVMALTAVLTAADFEGEKILRPFFGLMVGAAIIVLLGIYDDIKGLKAPAKFAVQVLAALFVIAMGARIELFTNPLGASFQIGWLGIPVAVLWIVGVTNAVNLIDGLDGLAVGIGSIASLGLFAVAVSLNPFVATLAIILAGAGAGFLGHNFYPAKMFLGDSGSMFIGFTLAVLGLLGSFKTSTATVLVLPIIVLGLPLFDTLFAIFRRAKNRINPFRADREHIHHRLVRVGLHHRSVVLVMYFVSAYLALTAYSIARLPYQTVFLFLLLLTIGGVMALRTLRFLEERLETALAARQRRTAPARSGFSDARPRGRKTATIRPDERISVAVCEVRGFANGAEEPELREALCEEIHTMLSRRLRVHSVAAEPSGAGRMIFIVRTEPLEGSMKALVQDGLAWYFTDHQERLGADSKFPRIRWLGSPPSPIDREAIPRGGKRGRKARRVRSTKAAAPVS